MTATPLDGDEVVAVAADLGEEDRFPLADPSRADGWRAFVRGVVAELRAEGLPVARRAWRSPARSPQGSGLSSSAALEVALCLALLGPAGDGVDRVRLARLCSRVENEWVGAQTGLLDQLASLLRPRGARAADRLRHARRSTPVPLRLGGWTLVTVDSGERHANASGGYNERRAECEQACARLGRRAARDGRPRRRRRAARSAGPPRPPRARGGRARARGGRGAARRRPRAPGGAARRLPRQPARPLRRVHPGGRARVRACASGAAGRG